MRCAKSIFSRHALQRMFEGGIAVTEVEDTLANGTVIEDYSDDQPYPSRLLLGGSDNLPVHAVVAWDESDGTCIVVTVYRPSPEHWQSDYKTRKP
jgi:hypothetical protein